MSRVLVAVATTSLVAVALAGCSSKKASTTTTLPTNGTTPNTTQSTPASTAPAGGGSGSGADRLFASGADLCSLIDKAKLASASGLDLQAGQKQGSNACYFPGTGTAGQVIVTAEKDMPALALDSKMQLNGVGNVTVKEVTVSGAKRAVLETQPLPDQINQTLIVLYDGGGIQLLISGKDLTDAKATAAAEAVANG